MKRLWVLPVVLLMTGCSMLGSHSSKRSNAMLANCSGNPYLQMFNCSMSNVMTAAKRGDPDAQYALGYMYFYGIGTQRDSQSARLWIQKSASQGQPLAKRALDIMANEGELSVLHPTRPRSSGGRFRQPRRDVAEMNRATPTQPLQSHLPAYRKRPPAVVAPSMTSPTSPAASPASAPASSSISDPRLSPQAKANMPLTSPTTGTATAAVTAKPGYTLQVMASHDYQALKSLVVRNHLSSSATIYESTVNGKQWYTLGFGRFESAQRARQALTKLPLSLRRYNPWAKSLSLMTEVSS